MTATNTPRAEVDIDEALVRELLVDQHPDLAELPLVRMASGWDNAMFRLGDDLAVRLPRRAVAVPLVRHEQRWLPELAARLPLPVPEPVRRGTPGAGYPWDWSVCRWVPGTPAIAAPLADPETAARSLAAFLGALHQPAPTEAPANPYRGVPLGDRSASVAERVERLHATIDAPLVLRRWSDLVATPPWTGPALWLHGDLHPANLLVQDGRLSGVIDFGDLTAGDPAADLSVAWMMFSPEVRTTFRAALGGVDDDTWRRAQGWALALALAYLAHSADNPPYEEMGRRTFAEVLGEQGVT